MVPMVVRSQSGQSPWVFRLVPLASKAMSRIRGALLRAAVRSAGGHCGAGLRVEAGLRVRHGLHPGLDLGRDVYLGRDTTIDCPAGGVFRLGDFVTLTQGVFVSALVDVRIGSDTLVGEYTSIRDSNHRTDNPDVPVWAQGMISAPVVVGCDVWIGRGVAVLAGAVIGDKALIGANSVVIANIPGGAVAVGSPAKTVGHRTKKA